VDHGGQGVVAEITFFAEQAIRLALFVLVRPVVTPLRGGKVLLAEVASGAQVVGWGRRILARWAVVTL
jgi:hypothetical protein